LEVFLEMKYRSLCKFFLLAALVLCLAASAGAETLTVYSGAGLMHPMDDLKARFEKAIPASSSR
jgi:ABC-type molybdate transport system substrate-binding protein